MTMMMTPNDDDDDVISTIIVMVMVMVMVTAIVMVVMVMGDDGAGAGGGGGALVIVSDGLCVCVCVLVCTCLILRASLCMYFSVVFVWCSAESVMKNPFAPVGDRVKASQSIHRTQSSNLYPLYFHTNHHLMISFSDDVSVIVHSNYSIHR
jgi:hypothetical protein